jgi:hypothetical protein
MFLRVHSLTGLLGFYAGARRRSARDLQKLSDRLALRELRTQQYLDRVRDELDEVTCRLDRPKKGKRK